MIAIGQPSEPVQNSGNRKPDATGSPGKRGSQRCHLSISFAALNNELTGRCANSDNSRRVLLPPLGEPDGGWRIADG
jgi:hypothetical protein